MVFTALLCNFAPDKGAMVLHQKQRATQEDNVFYDYDVVYVNKQKWARM